eukprot:scaffold4420_cov187-Amphora_coffeaeformis.AAC.28
MGQRTLQFVPALASMNNGTQPCDGKATIDVKTQQVRLGEQDHFGQARRLTNALPTMRVADHDTVNGQQGAVGVVRRHAFVGKGGTPCRTDKAQNFFSFFRIISSSTRARTAKILARMSLPIRQTFGRCGFIGWIRGSLNAHAGGKIRRRDGAKG